MSAIACDIDSKKGTWVATRGPALAFSRTGARTVQQERCPHCDSIIYSRRHKLCGVCAEELPEACRFDARQAENVKSLLREEQIRHRAWMQRSAFAN